MWYGPPGRVPMPLNTSAYSCRMYSLVVGKGWFFPFIVMELLHQETCGDFGSCAAPDFASVITLCSSCAVWSNFDWLNFQLNFWSNLGLVCRLSIDCAVHTVWSNFGWSYFCLNFDQSNFWPNLGLDYQLCCIVTRL